MRKLLLTSRQAGANYSRRTGNNCASGPKTIHRRSPTSTLWCRLSSRASKGGTPMPCVCTSTPFNPLANTASSRTRALPMRWPHGSTRRAAWRALLTHICETRGNCYNQWGALGKVKQLDERYPRLREERLPALTASTIGTPVRAVGRRDCSQGLTGTLERDCSSQADREAHANRGRACRCRARAAHPSARG